MSKRGKVQKRKITAWACHGLADGGVRISIHRPDLCDHQAQHEIMYLWRFEYLLGRKLKPKEEAQFKIVEVKQ